jgi:signal transduction histidine kinase
MDEFLSIASHELRTPLTTVKGYVQLAQYRLERIAGAETQDAELVRQVTPAHEMLLRTDSHIKRLTRLIDDLLDVSRIHANRLEMRPEPCNLFSIVHDAVQEQQQIHPSRAITMTTTAMGPGTVTADGDRIGQVVTNYVSNAVKYSPADRPIEVGIRVEGGVACVWVRDEGPGLADEERTHIWDRFYRVGGIEPHSGSHVGLGLGLYISRTIVEWHRGQVGVESTPGQGSTFWFTLPLTSAGEAVPA